MISPTSIVKSIAHASRTLLLPLPLLFACSGGDEPIPLGAPTSRSSVATDNEPVLDEEGDCVPSCEEKTCGDDRCGGSCGGCEDDEACSGAGSCIDDFAPPVSLHGQLAVVDGQVVDEDGNPVQLRGVSTQWLNWEKVYAGNPDSMKFMRDKWGMKVYRIANGVEFNNGYAEESVREERHELVKTMIRAAIDADIYVIVDWHSHETSYLDLAKEFFGDIAEEFGDSPHVIYETLNEPIGPSDDEEIAEFWSNELKPYHEQIVATIREHDPDNLIILGTPRWSQRVDVAAKSPVEGENLAYTLHFYSCSHDDWLRGKAQSALSAGAALFVTEWASTHADGGTSDNPGVCLNEANIWHDWLDDRDIGSASWKLNTDGDSSAILLSNAPSEGGWTGEHLSEHGQYLREVLLRP